MTETSLKHNAGLAFNANQKSTEKSLQEPAYHFLQILQQERKTPIAALCALVIIDGQQRSAIVFDQASSTRVHIGLIEEDETFDPKNAEIVMRSNRIIMDVEIEDVFIGIACIHPENERPENLYAQRANEVAERYQMINSPNNDWLTTREPARQEMACA